MQKFKITKRVLWRHQEISESQCQEKSGTFRVSSMVWEKVTVKVRHFLFTTKAPTRNRISFRTKGYDPCYRIVDCHVSLRLHSLNMESFFFRTQVSSKYCKGMWLFLKSSAWSVEENCL